MKLRDLIYCLVILRFSAASERFECYEGAGNRLRKAAVDTSSSTYCTADVFMISNKPSFMKFSYTETNDGVAKSYRIPGCVPVQKDGIDGFICYCQYSLCNTVENVQEWIAEFGVPKKDKTYDSLRAMRNSGRYKRYYRDNSNTGAAVGLFGLALLPLFLWCCICCGVVGVCMLGWFGLYKLIEGNRQPTVVVQNPAYQPSPAGMAQAVVPVAAVVPQSTQSKRAESIPKGAEPSPTGSTPSPNPAVENKKGKK